MGPGQDRWPRPGCTEKKYAPSSDGAYFFSTGDRSTGKARPASYFAGTKSSVRIGPNSTQRLPSKRII